MAKNARFFKKYLEFEGETLFPKYIRENFASLGEMIELDDQNFEKEVLKSEKLVLVNFWRPGCGPCLRMEPIIEEVAKGFNNRVEVGKLNIIENLEITKTYGIPATPTLIIFKNGKPIEKAVGLRSKQILIDKLNSLL